MKILLDKTINVYKVGGKYFRFLRRRNKKTTSQICYKLDS